MVTVEHPGDLYRWCQWSGWGSSQVGETEEGDTLGRSFVVKGAEMCNRLEGDCRSRWEVLEDV